MLSLGKYEKAEDSIAKYYNDLLLNQIRTSSENNEEEQQKYIAAFSQYLCKSSEAYSYNLTYLLFQHEEFCRFLHNAKKKHKAFSQLLEKIRGLAVAQAFQKEKPEAYKRIRVVFNDLLEGKLDGSIYLSENFLVSGATCREKDDMFTVRYENQRRSGYATMNTEDLEMLVHSVLSVPKEVYENGR